MNESTEVTLDQVEACLALFKAVQTAMSNAVVRDDEMCVDTDVWTKLLDVQSDVAEQWDW